jgi:hypothetical protein
MDMAALRKKVILIPTPGQTEQEYLAERLMQRKIAFYMPQYQFNLNHALKESKAYSGFINNHEGSELLNTALDLIAP